MVDAEFLGTAPWGRFLSGIRGWAGAGYQRPLLMNSRLRRSAWSSSLRRSSMRDVTFKDSGLALRELPAQAQGGVGYAGVLDGLPAAHC